MKKEGKIKASDLNNFFKKVIVSIERFRNTNDIVKGRLDISLIIHKVIFKYIFLNNH